MKFLLYIVLFVNSIITVMYYHKFQENYSRDQIILLYMDLHQTEGI